jgi:23S rRNA (adenine2503-C2)-methyltransferase
MFMSMGEPLLNPKGLYPALTQLYHLYPHAALLISTIGPNINYQPLLTLAKNIPTIGLQFSVHESTDHKRNQLIPFANKLTLQDIAHVGEEFFTLTGRNPFFNYCVHDQNNSQENAQQLAQLFHPAVWQATISVICEREEHVAAANQRQQQLAQDFQTLLAQYQYRTRVFNPAGQDDVGGGCGQLWFVQEWMHNHPKYARPSIGNGLPILHTPSLKV